MPLATRRRMGAHCDGVLREFWQKRYAGGRTGRQQYISFSTKTDYKQNQSCAVGMARSVIGFKLIGFLNLDVTQWQVRNKEAAGRVLR